MIPSMLATEVHAALEDFLRTGFTPSNPELAHVVDEFLAASENLARGPYLTVQLPFQPAHGSEPFPDTPLGAIPYRHQRTAFDRLRHAAGRSTVVATGTGSGKTECFLYPILDYCRAHAGVPGIKAIIIYPMNALAVDQARRIAEFVHAHDALRGKVTAGLFVGQAEASPYTGMGESHIISDRGTMHEHPPDILLTNYKMLDYLLVRPRDRRLWRFNDPATLRYLVVDELHTFDGAQGTDLACLIPRLRARLGVARERLICVGTSATIGGAESGRELIDYVGKIFDQSFDDDAVVGETRQSIDEFLKDTLVEHTMRPHPNLEAILDPGLHDSMESYLRAQYELLFDAEPVQTWDDLDSVPAPVVVAAKAPWATADHLGATLLVKVPLAAITQYRADAMTAALHLDDDTAAMEHPHYRRYWNGALRAFNLLQFLSCGWWTTTQGVTEQLYPDFDITAGGPPLPVGGEGVWT
jgi:DEAD/DEAH box helicase domain-containing protein